MELGRLFGFSKKKPPEDSKYGGFNRRMLAATVDSLILLLLLPLINTLAPIQTESVSHYNIDPQDPYAARHFLIHVLSNRQFITSWTVNFFMQMLFWCVYSAIFLHFWSATPGKMMLRMKVVDAKTEGPINDVQVFLRSFGYLVSTMIFCLGFVWINLNKRKRAWHDYLADTVVINLPLIPKWKKNLPGQSLATPPPETTETTGTDPL